MGLRDCMLFDIISRNARVHAQRTAIVFEGKRITHREYLGRVERLAAGLAAAGLSPGDRIGVVSLNCLEYLDLYGAAARLGAVMLPVNWRLSAEEIVRVLNDATPKLVFVDAEHQSVVAAVRDQLPSVECCYALGAAQAPFVAYAELLRTDAAVANANVDGDSGYLIIHTAAVAGRARGPSVFQGYWNCDTDNTFTFRNGWHHTGDMGRFDEDGYLWYAGRSPAKELIKPGGENAYPAEVERAILEHAAIAEVVVLGVADAQWGEAVKAVCVCKPGARVSAQDLIDFVGRRIARFKKPKHVAFVAQLPRTAAGTVDRQAVKQEHGHLS